MRYKIVQRKYQMSRSQSISQQIHTALHNKNPQNQILHLVLSYTCKRTNLYTHTSIYKHIHITHTNFQCVLQTHTHYVKHTISWIYTHMHSIFAYVLTKIQYINRAYCQMLSILWQ